MGQADRVAAAPLEPPYFKRIGDSCGGFVAEDENTAFMIDPRWARIRVKWDASSNPRSVVVSEGDTSFVIQLWWEFQPQMMGECRPSKQNRGRETREEGEVSTRASESVEQAAKESVKRADKTIGALHGEKGKNVAVGGQNGMLPWEVQKQKLKRGSGGAECGSGEKGKNVAVGGQNGMLPWEVQKQKLKRGVEQKEWEASLWCSLGPTSRV